MKITSKHLLAAAATTALFAGTGAQAASMVVDFQRTIASEQTPFGGEARFYHVSINSNNPGIGGFAAAIPGSNDLDAPFTRAIDNPVVGYAWVGGTNNDISGISLQGGESNRIVYTTQDTTFDGFGQNQLKFWDATDPGADIATGGADPFNVNTFDANPSGYRSFGGAETTIDVSGLSSGSLYIFYGAFNATPSVSVTLSGPGQPDIVIADAHLNGDNANRTEYYVAEVDFVTDGVYDTITYEHLANGTDYSGNGRGLGTLLTGVSGPPQIPGDTDGDGDIDDADLGTSFSNYTGPLAPGVGGKTLADGDTDGDGDVDDADLGTSFSGYTGPLAAAVPEPTSLALLGLGGLLVARRRRA